MHILCATFRKTNMFTFRQSLYWNDPLSFSTVFSFSIKLVVLEQPPVLRTTDCPQQFLTTCSVFISEARFSFSCLSLVWIVRLFKSMGGRKKLAPSASSWDWLDVRKHSQFVLIVISVIYQNWLWLMSYKWEPHDSAVGVSVRSGFADLGSSWCSVVPKQTFFKPNE